MANRLMTMTQDNHLTSSDRRVNMITNCITVIRLRYCDILKKVNLLVDRKSGAVTQY